MKKVAFGIVLSLVYGPSLWADDETRAAVKTVQDQMKSPQFREEAAKQSPEASKVRDQVKGLAGDAANEQEIYNLAAEVLGNFKDMTPEEMTKALEEAQKNPETFGNGLTSAQKSKLEEIAKRLPASKKKP